jgi:hypothetical protein
MVMLRIRSPRARGRDAKSASFNKAAAPVTTAAAALVPENHPNTELEKPVGAVTPGTMRPSLVGPCELNVAIVPESAGSIEPTAKTPEDVASTTDTAAEYSAWVNEEIPAP